MADVIPLSWLPGRTPPLHVDRLDAREWARLYRILGLSQDASRQRVLRATARLRKKYAQDEEALERVENANLWIMTRFMSRQEEDTRKQQRANRLRELGSSPKRLVPPVLRRIVEVPTVRHLRTASGLLGAFALLGLCIPTQASNFVGLAAAATMGLVYQRGRPEPVKDAGEVQKIVPKEMGGTVLLTMGGVLLSALAALGVSFLIGVPFQVLFCSTACSVLWLVSIFFQVYQRFDQ